MFAGLTWWWAVTYLLTWGHTVRKADVAACELPEAHSWLLNRRTWVLSLARKLDSLVPTGKLMYMP